MSRHQRAKGQFRVSPNRDGAAFWRIGVPREIAEVVEGIAFTCHLTEDGILFRPTQRLEAPSWAANGASHPREAGEGRSAEHGTQREPQRMHGSLGTPVSSGGEGA